MVKKNKTPMRTPRAKTPVIKTIEVMKDTALAISETMPHLKISEEKVAIITNDPYFRKLFLMGLIFIVFVLCLVLYLYNHADNKQKAIDEFGDKIPGYVFDPWFVVIFLSISLLGLAYIVYHLRTLNFVFFTCAVLYLVSFVMLFVKLYFSIALHSSAVQIFSFIIFVTSVLLVLQCVQHSNHIFYSIVCIIPSIIYSGFTLYTGGLLNPN
jgi:hypothetical protein